MCPRQDLIITNELVLFEQHIDDKLDSHMSILTFEQYVFQVVVPSDFPIKISIFIIITHHMNIFVLVETLATHHTTTTQVTEVMLIYLCHLYERGL